MQRVTQYPSPQQENKGRGEAAKKDPQGPCTGHRFMGGVEKEEHTL